MNVMTWVVAIGVVTLMGVLARRVSQASFVTHERLRLLLLFSSLSAAFLAIIMMLDAMDEGLSPSGAALVPLAAGFGFFVTFLVFALQTYLNDGVLAPYHRFVDRLRRHQDRFDPLEALRRRKRS